MKNQENSFPLPSDILAEIFLLLPLQSVLKCKIVSKAWKNAIEDPLFVKLYKVESTSFILRGNALSCLFFRGDGVNYRIVRRIPAKIMDEAPCYLYSQKPNNVVCVKYDGSCFHLYNVLTGDVRDIDDAPNRYIRRYRLFHGFGYDSHEDDYKMLFVSLSESVYLWRLNMSPEDIKDYESVNCKSVVFVYSYKNRGWQIVKGFPNYLDYDFTRYNYGKAACYLNGHLHYLVIAHDTPLVAAFNVHDYRLAVFALPPPFSRDFVWGVNLTELDGCLCCTDVKWDPESIGCVDVWVMKEYSVAESWTKLFCLDLAGFSSSTWSWYDKLCANIELHRCQDEREMLVVFQQEDESKRLAFLRYTVEDNGVMRFSSQQTSCIATTIKKPASRFLDKLVLFGRGMFCLNKPIDN